jgi:hypothetical protein
MAKKYSKTKQNKAKQNKQTNKVPEITLGYPPRAPEITLGF